MARAMFIIPRNRIVPTSSTTAYNTPQNSSLGSVLFYILRRIIIAFQEGV